MPPIIQTVSPSVTLPEPVASTALIVGRYRVELSAALINEGATLALQSVWDPQPNFLSSVDVRDFLAAREAALPALLAQLMP
jgi:hypothetical protein